VSPPNTAGIDRGRGVDWLGSGYLVPHRSAAFQPVRRRGRAGL